MKRLIPLILGLLTLAAICWADDTEQQLKSFLQSRKVINQVYFSVASSTLDSESKMQLDSVVEQLRKLSDGGTLLRVEGFASPEGDEKKNVNLSMYRAMAVRNYLRDKHSLNLDLFLTGYGGTAQEQRPGDARRVDIASYQQPKAAMALFSDQGTVEKISVK